MTLQKLDLSGSDIFFGVHSTHTKDPHNWPEPVLQPGFDRVQEEHGIESVPCDFHPQWHWASQTLIGVGHNARYLGDHLAPDPRRRQVVYGVYDQSKHSWGQHQTLQLPDEERWYGVGAGSAQITELPDGDVLIPVYHREKQQNKAYHSRLLRCSFDGQTLTFKEAGSGVMIPVDRGLCEPSVTTFQGKHYVTLRNDQSGYVSTSGDDLQLSEPHEWCWEDGTPIGNYNTQQHWVTHSDALFLTYTRKGANNDRVFRHRAPIFIAQVDTERLCLIRSTEQAIIPERGARCGNFGVTAVSPNESWLTVAEWMQPRGCEKYGSDNSIWVVRIRWDTPNRAYPFA